MSDLIVIAFDDQDKAQEISRELAKLQKEHLLELEDAVVVVKDSEGKLQLHQAVNLTAAGAVGGGFWGLFIGLLFGLPLVGALAGAAGGALSGRLGDYGIDDNFIKEVGATLQPDNSALFILLKKITLDKVLDQLSKFEGKILKTSLPKDLDAQLQAALAGKLAK
jgi:uncharacterized membrane protein